MKVSASCMTANAIKTYREQSTDVGNVELRNHRGRLRRNGGDGNDAAYDRPDVDGSGRAGEGCESEGSQAKELHCEQ
jgi:hypothetical protein